MNDISHRVRTLVMSHFSINEDRVAPETSLIMDLGADSLDTVEIAMALEQEFDVQITDGDFEEIKTIGDIETFIQRSV